MFTGTLSGTALISALDAEIARTVAAIAAQLRPYDHVVTPQSWHRILQGTEELINVLTEPLDDAALHDAIAEMPLAAAIGPMRGWLEQTIQSHFDGGIEIRMLEVLQLIYAFDAGCTANGLPLGLTTVAGAVGYLQTRRRRMVSLFYVMPQLCQGAIKARTAFDLVPFMTLIELAAGPVIDLTQARMLAHLFPDFSVTSNEVGYKASRTAELLDTAAMDPERVSLVDMVDHGVLGEMPLSDGLDPRRILSKAEVVHQIALIKAAYAEFNIDDTSFTPVAALILPLLQGEESHVVTVPAEPFLAAVDQLAKRWPDVSHAAFVNAEADYAAALNGHQPFVRIDDQLVTNVTLLTRFFNDWKNQVLGRKKRFQVRSGFLFEKKVKAILEPAGFQIEDVRRIDRREFDVVTTKGGVIHNFQCKNSFLDGRLIGAAPARYARINTAAVKSYKLALDKERGREGLLLAKLGLNEIRHYVVSRFPVLSDAPEIIPFTKLAAWAVEEHP